MGFIYCMRTEGGDFAKIGLAANPESRLAGCQTGCPVALYLYAVWEVKDMRQAEREAHQALSNHRVRGEWFWWSEQVEAYVKQRADRRNSTLGAGRKLVSLRHSLADARLSRQKYAHALLETIEDLDKLDVQIEAVEDQFLDNKIGARRALLEAQRLVSLTRARAKWRERLVLV